jgi:hypothetical protein
MNASLLVLHDHWLTAEAVFDYVEADFVEPTPTFRKVFEDRSRMYRTSEVWMTLIYVVIEGYEGLNARDKRIDALLTDTDRARPFAAFATPSFIPRRSSTARNSRTSCSTRHQPRLVRRRKCRFPRILRERGPDGRVIRLTLTFR